MNKNSTLLIILLITCNISAQTHGTLTVSATTSQTTVPSYKPENIVAMWIEDNSGKFTKTLLALAGERKQYLKGWKTVTSIAKTMYNSIDAITGATQTSHGTRTCTWNGKNYLQVLVVDGTYTLKMELADNDGEVQNLATFTFTKGPTPQTTKPVTTKGFSNISIEWKPLNTAVDEVEANSMYQIYPNPVLNKLYISGDDIRKIDICNMDGKVLYSTSTQNIYLHFLPKGFYMVNITARKGNFIRKFLKD